MKHYMALAGLIVILISHMGCRTQPDTLLTMAAAQGDTQTVQALLAQGTSVNMADRRGLSALICAARAGNIPMIETLLDYGADPNQRGGGNDWTPMMHAIHKGQEQAVVALLDGGADVNAQTRSGLTALMMAAGYGYTEIVLGLLAGGADPFAEDHQGNTALSAAVSGVPDIDKFTLGDCQTATVRALLEKAPGLKLKDNFFGCSARLIAKWGRCSDVLNLLEQQAPSSTIF